MNHLAIVAILGALACHPRAPIVVPREPPADELGVPPRSVPRGEPIAIAIVPLAIGDARTRHFTSHFVIRDAAHATEPRQVSDKVIALREELVSIDGEALVYKATVSEATETMVLGGESHAQTLLRGAYIVGVFPPGGAHVAGAARADHSELGDRELAEIDEQYGVDAGRPTPVARIVAAHPLRAGESIALSEAERRVYHGGETLDAPVALTAIAASGATATYQLDAVYRLVDGTRTTERRLRMTYELERASGRTVRIVGTQHDVESDPTSRETRDLEQRVEFAR